MALSELEAQAWVDAVARAVERCEPFAPPPDFAARCSLAQAQALQEACTRRALTRLGGELIGIKLGATNAQALSRLGLPAPFVGPIFAARSHDGPARLSRADFIVCIIEVEIGVRLARDIGGTGEEPSREELLSAIDQVFPAIEVADSRLQNWAASPAAALVADMGCAGAWVKGAPCASWRGLDLAALTVTLSRDGETIREGSSAAVLGDPLRALAMTVAELGRQGRRLRAGEFVSTGACAAPYPSEGGGRYLADFGALGSVALELTA